MGGYYVDKTLGNDGNLGTISSPWQNLTKADDGPYNPDDSLFFKRGETWAGTFAFPSSGTEGHPCIVDAYGIGELPIIDGTGQAAAIYYLNGKNWVTTNNLELIGSALGGSARTIRVNSATNLEFNGVVANGGQSGLYMEGTGGGFVTCNRCVFKNNTIGDNVLDLQSTPGTLTLNYCVLSDSVTNNLYVTGAGHTVNVNNCILVGGVGYCLRNNSTSTINLKNSILFGVYGGADYTVLNQSTGTINYQNNIIQPCWLNENYTVGNIGGGTITDGGGNLYISPRIIHHRRECVFALTIDDIWADWLTIAALATIKGINMSLMMSHTDDATVEEWAALQAAVDAGHDICCHTRDHGDLTQLGGISIRYTGGASAAMTIGSNTLTTSCDVPADNLNLDLTNASYKTLALLGAAIAATGKYTCTVTYVAGNTLVKSICLADVAAQDIKTAIYPAPLDQTRYFLEEITNSKADIEANLTAANDPGTPYQCKVFAFPYGSANVAAKVAIAAAGFLAARQTQNGQYFMTSLGMFSLGSLNVETIIKTTNTARNVETILDYGCYRGMFVSFYGHELSSYDIAYWEIILNTVAAYKADHPELKVRTLTEAVDYIIDNGAIADGGVTYTRTFDDNSNYRLRADSPAIGAGDPTLEYATDILGLPYITRDIGPYAYQGNKRKVINIPGQSIISGSDILVIPGEGAISGTGILSI